MKRKQIQYAQPYKIRSVQSVFNADDDVMRANCARYKIWCKAQCKQK